MKEIANFIINFTTNGGMLYVIIGLFLIGFGVKTAGSLCYDDILDKIENFQLRKSKRAESIVLQYENEVKFGKNINNLNAFVERSMHGWRIKGILVEKMQGIGDIFGKMCLILGICAVAILLAGQKDELSFGSQMTKGIYIYGASVAVLFICLKLWDNVIALDYKRNVIRDEIINYLDNNHAVDGENIPVVNVEIKDAAEGKKEVNKNKIEEIIKEEIIKDEIKKEEIKKEQNKNVESTAKNDTVKKAKRNSKTKKGKKNISERALKNINDEKEIEDVVEKKEEVQINSENTNALQADTNQKDKNEKNLDTANDKEIERIFDEVLEEFLS